MKENRSRVVWEGEYIRGGEKMRITSGFCHLSHEV